MEGRRTILFVEKVKEFERNISDFRVKLECIRSTLQLYHFLKDHPYKIHTSLSFLRQSPSMDLIPVRKNPSHINITSLQRKA